MSKKEIHSNKRDEPRITVVNMDLPSYDDDPALIRAKERALKLLQEAPLPDFIAKRINKSAD